MNGRIKTTELGKTSAGIALVLCLTSLLLFGMASAVPITENTDLGWQVLINNSYLTGEVSHNNTFLASASLNQHVTVQNETLAVNASHNNALEWTVNYNPNGYLFMGQLYPAGHTKFRYNMSVVNNGTNSYVRIFNGQLFDIEVYGYGTYHRVYLPYYAANGTYIFNKYFSQTGMYVDFSAEYFPNGTIVVTNNQNPLQNLSAKYHADQTNVYNYTATTLNEIRAGTSNGARFCFYNFEQSIPKKQITVLADNKKFPFGQDGPRANYAGATEWFKAHPGQSETMWVGPAAWNPLSAAGKADVLNLTRDGTLEVGIHFDNSLNSLSWSAAVDEVTSQMAYITGIFNTTPVSFCSLGDGENYTHATMVWNNYSTLWRNVPNSNAGMSYPGIYMFLGSSTVSSDDNTNFWKTASQYGSFIPVYTHSVVDPLTETNSIDLTNFTLIMNEYVSQGITIVPYGRGYYEAMNTAQPINDVLLDTYGSHFSIDSQGYNASTRIIDPFGERVWYSATPGMTVITEIDNSATETNLTIRNNATDPVIRQANASIVPSSGKILVNVKNWTTTGTAYKTWNESATDPAATTIHQIGDFPANTRITVTKNSMIYDTFMTNSTGWMNFTYLDGYSDIMFEAEADLTPVSSFTVNATEGYSPLAIAFTDTSTNTPDSWTWNFTEVVNATPITFSTSQNPDYTLGGGNYTITLNAANSYGSNLSTQITWINVSAAPVPSASFTANQTEGYANLPVLFTDTSTNAPTTWEWNFTAISNSTPIQFSTSQNPTYTFGAGNYSILLNATNVYGSSISSPTWINVSAPIPVAAFSANVTSGNAPLAVGFTDASTNAPSSWNWSFGDGDYSISQNPSHSYPSAGNYTVNLTATNGYGSDTLSLTDYISVTSGNSFTQQDIWMDEEYTLTLNFVDSSTGLPVPVVMVVDASNTSISTNTTTGVYTGTFGYETVVLYLYSDGYAAKAVSYVIDGDRSETVSLTKSTTASVSNTNVIYQAQLYRFIFQNLIGTPLGGVSVTITPINMTMNSSWANLLMGISSQVDIQNGILSGTTGSDGSLGTPLISPMGYRINVTGTAQSGDYVDYSIIEYPPSAGTDILISMPTNVTGFIHITPTPAFISYNIFNQTQNSTTETLSVNYNDPTGTTNITIVTVKNQSDYILNQTIYTGSKASTVINNFTYVQGVTSPPGDIISYGVSAYVSTAGGWNNITETITFNRQSSFTGNPTYDGWAAIIIMVLVSSAFTASTVYIGTIGVGLMGLFFYYTVKWFTPGVTGEVFIAMCIFWICIGVIGFITKKSRSLF